MSVLKSINGSFRLVSTILILFYLACGSITGIEECYGAAKAASKTRTVSQKSSVPAGMVSAEEALKRIKAHKDIINERLTDMSQKYDRDVNNTLHDMFVKNRVHQTAMMYVSSWSGNGVYLKWVNGLRSYYSYHLEILNESERPLKIGKSRLGNAKEKDIFVKRSVKLKKIASVCSRGLTLAMIFGKVLN